MCLILNIPATLLVLIKEEAYTINIVNMAYRSFGGRGRGYGGFVLGSDTLSSVKTMNAAASLSSPPPPPPPVPAPSSSTSSDKPDREFNPKKPKYDNPLAIAPPVNMSKGYGTFTLGKRRVKTEEE